MDFTEQELLIDRLDNWGRVYGERRAPGWRSSLLEHAIGQAVSRVSPADGRRLATVMERLGYALRVARVDGKPARIYQKKSSQKMMKMMKMCRFERYGCYGSVTDRRGHP